MVSRLGSEKLPDKLITKAKQAVEDSLQRSYGIGWRTTRDE